MYRQPRPATVSHHYHGMVVQRYATPRMSVAPPTRDMGTQTDYFISTSPVESPTSELHESVSSTGWSRAVDTVRAWFNRNRYAFEVVLGVVIFVANRVNIGIAIRPDGNR